MEANTVKDAQAFLRMFRAAAAFAEQVVDAEKAKGELADAKKQHAEMLTLLGHERQELGKLKSQQGKAEDARKKAEADAQQFLRDASHQASEITGAANKEASDMIAAAKLIVVDLQAEEAAAKKSLAATKKELAAAEAEKDKILGAIAELKAKF